VPGTVAHGQDPFPYSSGSDEEMARAGRELRNPYSNKDREAVARGKVIFDRNCAVCHGEKAKGDGVVVRNGFPPPPSLLTSRVREFRDGAIFYKITYGGPLMAAYGSQVSRPDRWKAILYLRELERENPARETGAGAAAAAGGGPGLALMKKSDCFACHAVDHKLVGPAYQDVAKHYTADDATVQKLVKKVKEGGLGNWGKVIPMPAHPQLSDGDLESMVRYVLSLAKPGKAASLEKAVPAPAEAPASESQAPDATPSIPAQAPAGGKGLALMKKNDCFACHAVDQKLIGPAYRDVAKHYAGADDVTVQKLVKKVKEGGMGTWGKTIPMTPHPQLSDEELDSMVRYILSLSKAKK